MKPVRMVTALAVAALASGTASAQAVPDFTIIHVFNESSPAAGVVSQPVVGHQTGADPASWALYGGNSAGGNRDHGVIYRLAPPAAAGGHWIVSRLYVFPDNFIGLQYSGPSSQLVFDAAGALYGAALNDAGCSTVFRLAPSASTYFWQKTTPYTASCATNGGYPAVIVSSLAMDAAGALYASTYGGPQGAQLLRLTRTAAPTSPWSVTVLHSFTAAEGSPTRYPVAFGSAGEVYGTVDPGTAGAPYGSVYRLTPPTGSAGAWHYEVIHGASARTDPAVYPSSLFYDASGTLYGTGFGRPYSNGIYKLPGGVFALARPAAGQTVWTETEIARFSGADGSGPNSLVRFGSTGPIYGTTYTRDYQPPTSNQVFQVGGAVFKLDPPASAGAGWTKTTLALTNAYQAGLNGPLVRDPSGGLYTSQPFGNLKYGVFNGDDGTILKINH